MILCAGEALIVMIPDTTGTGEAAMVPRAGGDVFNTAVALGKLGQKTGFLGGISTDFLGEMLIETLDAAQLDTHLSVRSGKPTTLAFVRLVDGVAEYTFYDENATGRSLSVSDLPDLGDDVEALFVGGISLAAEPCGEAYETLLHRETPQRVTMIDPNIRPSPSTPRRISCPALRGMNWLT